ncbi:MAG: NADH-quinone oxidoreductase subunit C [Bacteroidales bacterium]|nr:NADH-quinone oxidoreductase subunit C [Bacteroidales bacterium]
MKNLTKKLQDIFAVKDVESHKSNQLLLTVKASKLPSLLGYLKDFEGFRIMIMISAVDWIETGKYQLSYILNNPEEKIDLIIRVFLSRKEASMVSIHNLWGHASTFQREIKEMFGIDFPGSPRVDEPFLLEGWDDIPPMRRDFDTKRYSEETFFPRPGRETNDPAEYMKQRLYPDEPSHKK